MNGSPLDRRHDTLAKAFRRLGYEPTLFGYTDQSEDPSSVHANDPALYSYEGVLPGFAVRTRIADDQSIWRSWLEQQGYTDVLKAESKAFHIAASGVDDPPRGKAPVYKAEHTDTAFLVAEFKRWLAEQVVLTNCGGFGDQHNGWFAHVSFLRPHPPFVVPSPYNDMYSVEDVAPFKGANAGSSVDHPFLNFLHNRVLKKGFIPGAEGLVSEWSAKDLRHIAAVYYGMCSEVDAQIGQIVDSLESTGQSDNTIIVFTSDHGEQLGDQSLLGKYGFFDSSYHIPLIISDPGKSLTHGRVISEFTEAIDVMPTLLNMLDADIPIQLDGQSLVSLMNMDTDSSWRKAVHWEYDFRNVASLQAEKHFGIPSRSCNLSVVRNEKYKYVHFAALPSLLFDLENDPEETCNVIDKSEHQIAARMCAEELLSWRAQHLDQSLALSSVGEHGITLGEREPYYHSSSRQK